MRRTRLAPLVALAVGLLAVAVDPVAAQSTSSSATEELIWNLNNQLLYVAVPLTVLVEAILFYTVWRFRNNDSPLPTKENRRLEITWTVATAVILLFVGVASYQVLASPYVAGASEEVGADVTADGEEALEVRVIAQTYSWQFEYPEQNVSSQNEMVIPTDRTIRLNITSTDWIHALHVPGLGLKQDAFPGQYNYKATEVYETGEYQLYCAEYCGVGHSEMLATVDVRSQDAFQGWVDEQAGNESG